MVFRSVLLFFIFFGVAFFAYAQNLTVSGVLLDDETSEAIPMAQIRVDSLKIAVQTDLDGLFMLQLPRGNWVVTVNVLGYELFSQTVIVSDKSLSDLTFKILPKSYTTDEVIIRPSENPAHRIIKNAVKNKKKNRISNLDAYEYDFYGRSTLTLDNISAEKLDKSLLLRPAKKFLQDRKNDTVVVDSNKRYKLGIFISEANSRIYYKKPQKIEIVLAQKATGGESMDASLISSLAADVDVYESRISVVNADFLGPLDPLSLMNYRFYLIDTIISATGDSIFGIQMLPRNEFDKVFKGIIYIENSSWAIKKVDMTMNADPNLNFVENIRIRQEFEKIDGHWAPVMKDLWIDFKQPAGKLGFIGRSLSVMDSFIFNSPKPKKFYDSGAIIISEGANEKDAAYWEQNRASKLERSDELAYKFSDTLQQMSVWKTIVLIQDLLTDGKYEVGKIEFGPYSKVAGYNVVEGLRFQMGVNTNPLYIKRWYAGGHAAYGLGDSKWKYGVDLGYKLSFNPFIRVSYQSRYETEQAGMANSEDRGMSFLVTVLNRVPLKNINYYNLHQASIETEFFTGLRGTFYLRTKDIDPAFSYYYNDNNTLSSRYQITEAGVKLQLSFKEEYIFKNKEKVYLGSKYPRFKINYAKGFSNFMDGNFDYHRLSISVSDKIKTSRFGWLNYSATAGQIFGAVPIPSLYIMGGNQSYAFEPIGLYNETFSGLSGGASNDPVFNLMYFYEFIADRYVVAGAEHHFEGWVFKKIPLLRYPLRKLKWKEVVSARLAFGELSAANLKMNDPRLFETPDGVSKTEMIIPQSPNVKPYMELGAGIDNILRFIRVDAIWRLTYQTPNPPPSLQGYSYNFGIRFNLFFQF